MEPPGPVTGGGGRSPPIPPVSVGAAGAPPAPEVSGSEHTAQLWLKQLPPPTQTPQSTNTPHALPEPHCQSIPHFGTWQQDLVELSQTSLPQPQSAGQLPQFSP